MTLAWLVVLYSPTESGGQLFEVALPSHSNLALRQSEILDFSSPPDEGKEIKNKQIIPSTNAANPNLCGF